MSGAANTLIVIRGIGERTEALCRALASQQVSEENVVSVCESPFSAALVKSFEIALERKREFTMGLDADVLLRPGAVREIEDRFRALPQTTYVAYGLVLCKFHGGMIPGLHFYRTSLLRRALELAAASPLSIRPETTVARRMAEAGYPFRPLPVVLGLHDYEQYYRDIYAKMFNRARKSANAGVLVQRLAFHSASDDDCRIAACGARLGVALRNLMPSQLITPNDVPEVELLLARLGLTEKRPLPGNVDKTWVTKELAEHVVTPNDIHYEVHGDRSIQVNPPGRACGKGAAAKARLALGEALIKIGYRLLP